MRNVIFLRCEAREARQADAWARQALEAAGTPPCAARKGGLRLAAGLRAAAAAFAEARCACGGAPKAMLALTDEDGELAFELIADGDQCVRRLADRPAGKLWQAERRVAGDGATRLRMPATA